MPQMLFYGIAALATAMLNAQRRFLAAAFAPVLNNVVVIAVFLTLPRLADGSLTRRQRAQRRRARAAHRARHDGGRRGDGAGAAAAARAACTATCASSPRWRHPAVLTMLRLSGWTVGYVIANQIALLVVTDPRQRHRRRAVHLHQRVHVLPAPARLVRGVADDDVHARDGAAQRRATTCAALRMQVSRGIRLAALVVVPASAMYIGLARPIIVALLQRGSFDGRATRRRRPTRCVAFSVGSAPVLDLPLRAPRVLRAPRHVHAVLDQLHRERR